MLIELTPHGEAPIGESAAEFNPDVGSCCWLAPVEVAVAVLSPEGFSFSFSPC